ncbi:DNA cytosine methyltransferase, partial [Stenotrophomonas maltophilia]
LAENDGGKTLETIISILEEIGYEIVEKDIYKALFYKTPQKRERLIIIGVRKDLVGQANFEKPSPYHRILNLRDAFKAGELYEDDVPESISQKYPQRKAEIMSHVPEGGYWRDLPLELQIEYMKGSFHLGGGK